MTAPMDPSTSLQDGHASVYPRPDASVAAAMAVAVLASATWLAAGCTTCFGRKSRTAGRKDGGYDSDRTPISPPPNPAPPAPDAVFYDANAGQPGGGGCACPPQACNTCP